MSDKDSNDGFKWNPLRLDTNPRILRRYRKENPRHGFMSRTNLFTLTVLLVLFGGLFGINYLFYSPSSGPTTDLVSYLGTTAPTIDGVVSDGEYAMSYSYDGGVIIVSTQHVGDYIYFAIQCNSEGWCALGFNEAGKTSAMPGADIKMGIVLDNGTAVLFDKYAAGPQAPVTDDTSNIQEFAGKYAGIYTTFEFSIKLGDGEEVKDQVLTVGEKYTLLFATGPDKTEGSYHQTTRDKISFSISENEKT